MLAFPSNDRKNVSRIFVTIFVSSVAAVLAVRLFALVDRYAVNVLFQDQWDFYEALFYNHSLWDIFCWQHGPVRLGIGFVCSALLAGLSQWNVRVEVFFIVVLLCLSTVTALILKVRLLGPPRWNDVAIPLMFLTPLQWDVLLVTSIPSHGVFPQLLLMIYCLAWTIPSVTLRHLVVALLTFQLMFTGFGLFVGLITPPLLILDIIRSFRAKDHFDLLVGFGCLGICCVAVAIFFRGYVFVSAVDCFQFPDSQPWLYPVFVARMSTIVFPVSAVSPWCRTLMGGAFLLIAATVCVYHAKRLITQPDSARNLSLVIVVLVTFSVLFAINSAIGRLCLGLEASEAPRYIPCLVPGVLGVYLHLLTSPSTVTKRGLRYLLLAALLWAALPLSARDLGKINNYSSGKKAWKDVFLQTESIETADRASGFKIYPDPLRTHLQEKLEYLKRHKLNLYLDHQDHRSH